MHEGKARTEARSVEVELHGDEADGKGGAAVV
jgi:hypothetical protein